MALEPLARGAGAVLGGPQGPMGLAEVGVPEEGRIGPPEGAEVGRRVAEDPLLPEIVEALHMGVSARLPWGDEDQMDPQEQVQPHDEREGSGVSAAARGGHLVIDLRHPRHSQPAPGPHEMRAEELGGLVAALAGGDPSAHHGDRMERVEAGDPAGPPEVPRAHEVGLLEIPGARGARGGIGSPPPFRRRGSRLVAPWRWRIRSMVRREGRGRIRRRSSSRRIASAPIPAKRAARGRWASSSVRSSSTRATTRAGALRGRCFGARLRDRRPAHPSSRNRRSHLASQKRPRPSRSRTAPNPTPFRCSSSARHRSWYSYWSSAISPSRTTRSGRD